MVKQLSVRFVYLVICVVHRELRKIYIFLKKLHQMLKNATIWQLSYDCNSPNIWHLNMAPILTKSKYTERDHPEEY
jgi:hypothetical protein